VWSWRKRRVKKSAAAVDTILCLLPFEKEFFDERDVRADFVGHPMADNTPAEPDTSAARVLLGVKANKVVAVLPGSRQSEVSRLGPVFAAACARLIDDNPDIVFVSPMATKKIRQLFARHLAAAKVSERFVLIDGQAETVISAADVVLLASGTATLQTALLGKPMVAAYRFAPLTYAIAYVFNLVDVPYFSLPNLLTDEPQVPEFLQGEASPEALSRAVGDLLQDAERRGRIKEVFQSLRMQLARGADERAAGAILAVAGSAQRGRGQAAN